jgi:hypothetical protein
VKDFIPTYRGFDLDLCNPQVEQIDLLDIAHALSQVCRFAGHTSEFYSVAQHSVIVSRTVPPPYGLLALLHDAAEAYVGDVTSPLKPHLTDYAAIEDRIQAVILKRFGLECDETARTVIKTADQIVLATEIRDLIGGRRERWKTLPAPLPQKITPWLTCGRAALEFKARFMELVLPIPAARRLIDQVDGMLMVIGSRSVAESRDLAGSAWRPEWFTPNE